MAQQLYFTRYTKVFVEFDSVIWEIPVLDGFSFSQATNATEVTLSEMESTTGISRRGKKAFNDSLAPAEWSFSTYARPYFVSSAHGAVDNALWALMAGADGYDSGEFTYNTTNAVTTQATSSTTPPVLGGLNAQQVNFAHSNRAALADGVNIFFVLGDDNRKYYKMENATINEASIDFDVEGIATINWSGFGTVITDQAVTEALTGGYAATLSTADTNEYIYNTTTEKLYKSTDGAGTATTLIDTGVTDTNNFIRNRISQLVITDTLAGGQAYNLTLTGGNITINNNLTYLTPEELGSVNLPFAGILGERAVSGNFSCYLGFEDGVNTTSAAFYDRLKSLNTTVTNKFKLIYKLGGIATNIPHVNITIPAAHVEIPTHEVGDLISITTNFMGLGLDLDTANEAWVELVGPTT